MNAPLLFTWDGESMIPVGAHARACDARFVVGQRYQMEPVEERSAASHRHYFASIREAWMNLPEHLAARLPSPEHLRAEALIRTGYAKSTTFTLSSPAEAVRLASYRQAANEYAIIDVSRNVVTIWEPESQSNKAMGKARFQESKDRVLSVIAEMIGVARNELERERAA